MNRLSMFFALLSVSLSAIADEPIHNDDLGISVVPKTIGPMSGFSVESVLVGKPGDHTGLMKGDLLLGWSTNNALNPDGGSYAPMTPELFAFLPPKIATMNTVYHIRVFRPSEGRLANLTVYFGGSKYKPKWHGEMFGIAGMTLEINGQHQGLKIVAVYPHGLADDTGLQPGDEVLMAQLVGARSFSAPVVIDSAERLNDFLVLANKQPDDPKTIVRLVINRKGEWIVKQFFAAQLHAPKI